MAAVRTRLDRAHLQELYHQSATRLHSSLREVDGRKPSLRWSLFYPRSHNHHILRNASQVLSVVRTHMLLLRRGKWGWGDAIMIIMIIVIIIRIIIRKYHNDHNDKYHDIRCGQHLTPWDLGRIWTSTSTQDQIFFLLIQFLWVS